MSHRRILCWGMIFLSFAFSCQQPTSFPSAIPVSSGRVERFVFNSVFLATDRTVDVWLPEGYRSGRKYPVLYMHDGQMLFDSTHNWNHQEWGIDETMSQLMADRTIRKCIVVGIWNAGKDRHAEYFPQKPFESLPVAFRDSLLTQVSRNPEKALFSRDVYSDNYLSFIVTELKPMIDSRYSADPSASATFVAGSSMGGLISMYALCEYPDVFGGSACLSTHWPGIFAVGNNPVPDAFVAYLAQHLPDPATHKLYFDYGTETLDSLYEPYQQKVDSVMRLKGYDENHWKTQKFEGADHSENAWNSRFAIPVTFLMRRNSR